MELNTVIIGVLFNFLSLQLLEVAFRATEILLTVRVEISVNWSFTSSQMLSTVRVDIPVNRSFPTYIKPVNYQS